MKKIVFLVTCLFITLISFGQVDKFQRVDLHPTSPSVFAFTKYTEMPVSEYTGIPNITIPLYTIETDGVSVPLNLTYHAVGVRVSQEASWVGLGWDLQVGSLVQTINDRDDLGKSPLSNQPYQKKRPDFKATYGSQPFFYPRRYKYPCTLPAQTWTPSYPTNPTTIGYGYMIATDYYVPVGGQMNREENMLTSIEIDSEPDLFTANFLGYSIKFIIDPQTGLRVPLNKNEYSYKIHREDEGWRIVVPDGTQFIFQEKTSIKASSYGWDITGPASSNDIEPTSYIWMLKKIITPRKKEIEFNYFHTAERDAFPSYSDKMQLGTDVHPTEYNQPLPACVENYREGYIDDRANAGGSPLYSSEGYSKEIVNYLSSIVFPNGRMDFTLSDRTDVRGEKKLEQVALFSDRLLKSWQLNYDYFDAGSVGGNGYAISTALAGWNIRRLKLVSLQDNAGAKHQFTYNPTPLPQKNSFAQDFWGYYNGQLSNTSLVPDPASLKLTGLPANGNNRGCHPVYLKAAILEGIQYPTGGSVQFEYEPNQFTNYWRPDYNNIANTVTTGNGLRIKNIMHFTTGNGTAKKTAYQYEG